MNVQTFDFQESPVRVLERQGEPWFVAADVCRVLEISNSRDAVSGLDEDEKATVANTDSRPGQPGAKSFQIISESGLYALIFKSRKPEAKKFRRWVTSEVLPALRQTGAYQMPGLPEGRPLRGGTVEDQMMCLRELLLSSAAAVSDQRLDTGRAQQVANLSARFLETIKLEGEAIGYAKLFQMRTLEAAGGFLPVGHGQADADLQGLSQREVPGTGAAERGVSSAAVSSQTPVDPAESGTGAAAPAQAPWPPDLGPPAGGPEPSAEAGPGLRSGAAPTETGDR